MISPQKAFRLSFFTSLAISIAFFAYTLFGPANPSVGLMFAAPLAVLAVGLGAKALSTPSDDDRR